MATHTRPQSCRCVLREPGTDPEATDPARLDLSHLSSCCSFVDPARLLVRLLLTTISRLYHNRHVSRRRGHAQRGVPERSVRLPPPPSFPQIMLTVVCAVNIRVKPPSSVALEYPLRTQPVPSPATCDSVRHPPPPPSMLFHFADLTWPRTCDSRPGSDRGTPSARDHLPVDREPLRAAGGTHQARIGPRRGHLALPGRKEHARARRRIHKGQTRVSPLYPPPCLTSLTSIG